MTTEIAVANQLGIALATDSAVTITSGGHTKVFNTADKLFELSPDFSVAIMINGNMDFLGVPWEILIKDFRAKEGKDQRGSIEKWAKDFLDYIETSYLASEDIDGGYIDRVIINEIRHVQRQVQYVVAHYVREASRDGILTKGKLDIRKVLDLALELREKSISEISVATSLEDLKRDVLKEKYAEKIEKNIAETYVGEPSPNAEEKAKISDLIIEAMLRSVESDTNTGIVVAGYGADDTFPAVFSCEIDGRIAGKLKIAGEKYSPIAGCRDGGMVTSFAQTDVIERLLMGVDPRFVGRSAEFIERAVHDSMTKGFEATESRKPSPKKQKERTKLIREMAAAAKDEFSTEAAEKIKENFAREFDQMIAMMPKQELIELAEALVSITAIERKATEDEGTVGGPIDVALITKHEGFVWVKRKHHFPKDLNPRYFWRRFGQSIPGRT